MSRKILKLLIAIVILLVANIGIFTFVKDFMIVFWISYVFAMIACGISIYVEVFSAVKEKLIFRYSISAVTYLYLVVAVAAAYISAHVLILFPLTAFMIQLAILAAYIVCLLAVLINNSAIKEQQQERGRDIANFEYIKNLMNTVISKVPYGDPDRKTIQHAGDAIASGQVRSSEATYELEQQMILHIENLDKAVSENDRSRISEFCKQIEAAAEARKRILSGRARF
ncbi:MAG: hypothetical protein HDR29_00510 [Lachnospiraceae bacterium]|nr:hypothetical protein [Lachnospiraceae bacterium]